MLHISVKSIFNNLKIFSFLLQFLLYYSASLQDLCYVGDQEWLTLLGWKHPALFHHLPCQYNRQVIQGSQLCYLSNYLSVRFQIKGLFRYRSKCKFFLILNSIMWILPTRLVPGKSRSCIEPAAWIN